MKAHNIKTFTILMAITFWMFTGCEKDSFFEAPETAGYKAVKSDDNADMRYVKQTYDQVDMYIPSPSTFAISSDLKVEITCYGSRSGKTGGAADPDMDSKSDPSASDEAVAYTLKGSGPSKGKYLGEAMLSIDLQSNPRSGEVTGFIVLQSHTEKSSSARFRIWGWTEVQPVGEVYGLTFRLEVIEACGRYAGFAKWANGSLTNFLDAMYNHRESATAHLSVFGSFENE